MKQLSILALSLSLLLSCSKSSSGDEQIKYEVITNSSSTWIGSYSDETGANTTVNNKPSGWTITFTNKAGRPRTLYIQSFAVSGGASTANIYVNGNLVKSAQSDITGIAQAMYNLN